MASYLELYDLRNHSDLRNRVTVAVTIAADAIRGEASTVANHARRLVWAKHAFENSEAVAASMLRAILARQKSATDAATIKGVKDAALQAAVDAAVNVFAGV